MITSPGTKRLDAFAAWCDECENRERKQQALIANVRKYAMSFLAASPGTGLSELAEALNVVARDLWNANAQTHIEQLPQPAMNLADAVPCAPMMSRT